MRNGTPRRDFVMVVIVRPPITAVSPSGTMSVLSARCLLKMKPTSELASVAELFSAWIVIMIWRLFVMRGVTESEMPTSFSWTVARGMLICPAAPPTPAPASSTRIGISWPTRISALRLSRVTTVGSACTSASVASCSAWMNGVSEYFPSAALKIRLSAGLEILEFALAMAEMDLPPKSTRSPITGWNTSRNASGTPSPLRSIGICCTTSWRGITLLKNWRAVPMS